MRFTLYIILVLCQVVTTSLRLNAQLIRQDVPLEITAEGIGIAQGLSQGMVNALDVDLKGYLWIATKDGLNRYDGSRFHIFRNDPQDSTSIASNYIRALHIDDRGLIWVGTIASGLDLYNPVNTSFLHFGKDINPASPSSIQSVSGIYSTPSGAVLIWDGAGEHCEILVPKPKTNSFTMDDWQIKSLKDLFKLPDDAPSPNAYSMLGFAADGALLYHVDQRLYALYPDTVKDLTLDLEASVKDLQASNNSTLPRQYYLDNHRRLFCLSPSERALYLWDHSGSAIQSIQFPDAYPLDSVRFFIDHHDRIWNNSGKKPLKYIDPAQGTYQQVQFAWRNVSSDARKNLGLYCEDAQHNLWIGTSGYGMIKLSSRKDQFIRLSTEATQQLGVRVARNGRSAITHDVFTVAKELDLQERFEAKGIILFSGYAEDDKHYLWCRGSTNFKDQYLVRINPTDLSFTTYPLELCQSLAPGLDGFIMIDDRELIWIGGECGEGGARLMKYDPNTGASEAYTFPVNVIRNEHGFITDWYVDAENLLWLGTKQGLFIFNIETAEWKHYHADPDETDALSHNYILSICPDPKSPDAFLWIGTDGGGLNRMDIKAGTFRHFSTTDGLPNNVVYAVQSDAHDHLWLSTNLGICRFDPRTNEVWAFTAEDGLPGNEFNRLEYSKTPDGRLVFGGVEGIVVFDPETFYQSTTASPIVINTLKLSNKEVAYHHQPASASTQYTLPAPLEHCDHLTFPYTERMITLGYSLLDLTNPSGNKYRYKLEGFNNEWIEAGALTEAVFTNLSPGSYTFLVSGCNSNHVWSDPAQIRLTILAPWWATWWFRILIIIVIGAGVYAFYRYRLQQAMKLQHLRNRIAADLHDEIGSTLSSISLAGTVAQQKLKHHHPEVEGILSKINHNTQSMMEAMSDIVWAVNTNNDRFDHVLHRMRAFAGEILEPKDVLIHVDVSPSLSQLQLDMQQRKNLYLVFKEVINNAAKYAECSNVWITIQYLHGHLTMRIKDDGKGFQLDDASRGLGGNGIPNMHQRASELKGKLEILSSPGNGTTVTLNFPV